MSASPQSGAVDHSLRGLVWLVLLSACGRVGMQLTPLEMDDAAALSADPAVVGTGAGGGQDSPRAPGIDAGLWILDGGFAKDAGLSPDGGTWDSGRAPRDQDSGPALDGGAGDAQSACTSACLNPHGAAQCMGNACVLSCADGFADCDGDSANGCETPLDTPQNCGACGHECVSDLGPSACTAGTCTTQCDLTGTYALKLQVPTSWPARPLLSAGSGVFTYWVRLELMQDGLSFAATLTPCGKLVPDFRAARPLLEVYGIEIPTTLFDRSPALRAQTASGTLSELGPGARLSLGPTSILLGATLSDPVRDAWPSAGALRAVDADADGELGITGNYKSGIGYTLPPLNDLGSTRGLRGYVASRIVFSLSGTLDTCAASSGSVTTGGVDTHTLGCRVIGDLRDCLSFEADHLDTNGPIFTSGGGTYSLTRVTSGASCASVRSTLP